jgi:hypothetical protein
MERTEAPLVVEEAGAEAEEEAEAAFLPATRPVVIAAEAEAPAAVERGAEAEAAAAPALLAKAIKSRRKIFRIVVFLKKEKKTTYTKVQQYPCQRT